MTSEEVLSHPHIHCAVSYSPVFEGHLVKVLCSVLDYRPIEPVNPSLGSLDRPVCSFTDRPRTPAKCSLGRASDVVDGQRCYGQRKTDATLELPGAAEGLPTRCGQDLLTDAKQAFVLFDKSLESDAGIRSQVGSDFYVLPPFDIVLTPTSTVPVILAYVAILGDQARSRRLE
jgi:hypothetical protein